jgi:uncharacterized iron-regulated membrane protein
MSQHLTTRACRYKCESTATWRVRPARSPFVHGASVRPLLLIAHRWAGLCTAGFLCLAGLTGAVIAWDHELDAALNPAFHHTPGSVAAGWHDALVMADRLEAQSPGLHVTYLPLSTEAGSALTVFAVDSVPAPDASDAAPHQIALDPRSGQIQARRRWGVFSLAREHIMPTLYRFHYSLHLPGQVGVLLLGVLAVVWSIDSVIALALSFPSTAQWRKSFAFRLRAGGLRALFDLHRSSGVITWGLVLTISVTGVSMNLGRELVRPLLGAVAELTPTAAERLAGRTAPRSASRLTRAEALTRAQAEAARLGITALPGGIFEDALSGYFGVGFFAAGHEHADGALGNPWLYVDAVSGEVVARDLPERGTSADYVWRAQFPLHSGRLGGVAGRALVSVLGLVIAGLSTTGVLLWLKRRAAHGRARRQKRVAAPLEAGA